MRRATLFLAALITFDLAFPLAAFADNTVQNPVVTSGNLVLVALSLVVPLVGYVLNHYAPWASEPVKGIAQAVLAAGVGAAYQLFGSGDFGWNDQTAIACLTAMGVALLASFGYKAAGINVVLGGGANHVPGAPDVPSDPARSIV